MPHSLDCPVKILIDETSDAFKSYDSVNADYAAFASMALSEFKTVLNHPALTAQQLRRLLRSGHKEHRLMSTDNAGSWSVFMARYVSQNVNANDAQGEHIN